MKYTLSLLFAFFLFSTTGWSQNQYSTISNRVIISTIVNGDTLVIENLTNEVRLNGQVGLINVVYHNNLSRLVYSNGNSSTDERTDMVIEFNGEYAWLDEQIKSTEPFTQLMDEMTIRIESVEQYIPANFEFSRVRGGGLGFTSIINISGEFSGQDLEDDFPHLKFESELHFNITLTVRVTE